MPLAHQITSTLFLAVLGFELRASSLWARHSPSRDMLWPMLSAWLAQYTKGRRHDGPAVAFSLSCPLPQRPEQVSRPGLKDCWPVAQVWPLGGNSVDRETPHSSLSLLVSSGFLLFSFLRYWGLNSGPTPWATPPALFLWRVFWDRVSRTISLGWHQTAILLIPASWIAAITGLSHQCPAYVYFLNRSTIRFSQRALRWSRRPCQTVHINTKQTNGNFLFSFIWVPRGQRASHNIGSPCSNTTNRASSTWHFFA
jgi:hypothetical protein